MPRYTYDHIHLRSRDPEATARYYSDMFEAKVLESVQPDGQKRIDLDIVSNQQKWDTLGAERSGAGWRSGELPEGPVVESSPFGGLSLHLLPAL